MMSFNYLQPEDSSLWLNADPSTLPPTHSNDVIPNFIPDVTSYAAPLSNEEEEGDKEQSQPQQGLHVQFPETVQALLDQQGTPYADPLSATLLRYAQAQLPHEIPSMVPLAITWHGKEGSQAFGSAGKRRRESHEPPPGPSRSFAVGEGAAGSSCTEAAYYGNAEGCPLKRHRVEVDLRTNNQRDWNKEEAEADAFIRGRKRYRDPPVVEFVSMGRRLH